MRVSALIMAGGHGERFWPKSRADAPKQFLDIIPGGRSAFQETYERAASIVGADSVFVVTGQSFAGIVLSQVPSLSPERVVLEPSGRNTAPCLALGTAKILGESGCDPIVVALPSDHWVPDVQPFKQTVEYMIEAARNTGCIVTAGIVPTRPEPAYGYLKAGTPLDIHRGPTSVSRAGASDGPGPSAEPRVFRVTEFVEKPPLDKARLLHSSGGWYWNSGMFCYTASRLMEAYSWALPHDAEALKELVGAFSENPCPTSHATRTPFPV